MPCARRRRLLVEGGEVDNAGNRDWVLVRFTSTPLFADNLETGDRRRWSTKAP